MSDFRDVKEKVAIVTGAARRIGFGTAETFAGALLLIIINNGLGTIGVSPYIYPFVAGVVIFLAIYLDSLNNLRRSSRFE